MSIFMPKRKNDQYREGHTSLIYRSKKVTCPVGITERMLRVLPEKSAVSSPVVRRIVKSKSSEKFHDSKGVSYTTIRDEFRKHLAPFVDDINLYCTHSIRSGAASNAGNKDVVDKLLDRHAGWRCPSSKFRYISFSKEQLLSVTKNLGL